MRSLDNPASRFLPCSTSTLLFATATDVRYVTATFHRDGRLFAKVPFVEAQMLTPATSGGTSNGHRLKSLLQKALVVSISAVNGDTHGNAACVGQDRSLDAKLTSIGRVFPGFFPLRAATSLSRRPKIAIAMRSLGTDRISRETASRTGEKCQVVSTLGNSDEPYWDFQIVGGAPSIGSPCARDNKCRWRRHVDSRGVGPPWKLWSTLEAMAQAAARVLRASEQTCPANRSAYTPPCKQR